MNRRQFIVQTSLAGTIGPMASRVETVQSRPNDRVGVGVIGCGGMGRMDLGDFMRNPDVEVVAVCDVQQHNLKESLQLAGSNAKSYVDYRRLLEDRNVEAVVIATPDHWHALMCVDACAAGKDVYLEKPVSRCVREAEKITNNTKANEFLGRRYRAPWTLPGLEGPT
jgi:predicted dehydrogenase